MVLNQLKEPRKVNYILQFVLILLLTCVIFSTQALAQQYSVTWNATILYSGGATYQYPGWGVIQDIYNIDAYWFGMAELRIDGDNQRVLHGTTEGNYSYHFERISNQLCGANSRYIEEASWTITDVGASAVLNGLRIYKDIADGEEVIELYIPSMVNCSHTIGHSLAFVDCEGNVGGYPWTSIQNEWNDFNFFGMFNILRPDEEGSFSWAGDTVVDWLYDEPVIAHWEVKVKLSKEVCEVDPNRLIEWNQYGEIYSRNCYNSYSSETPCGGTIAQFGCALTSLAMALNYADYLIDPGVLNERMNREGGYNHETHGVQFQRATEVVTGGQLRFYDWFRANSIRNPSAANRMLEDYVCRLKYPVVVGVSLSPNGTPHHYVLVTGKEGDRWKISDPGFAEFPYLYGDYAIRGFVAPAADADKILETLKSPPYERFYGSLSLPGAETDVGADFQGDGLVFDTSELYLDANNSVELLVIDGAGNRTGFDSENMEDVEEIFQSSYARDGLRDDVTGLETSDGLHSITIFQPSEGLYSVQIYGTELGPYELYINTYQSDGSSQPGILIRGVADEGSESFFDIQFDPMPGSALSVTRVATFQSTIEDIENCRSLGMIDNKGIANSLIKKIQNAQKQADRGNTETAMNILNAFKNEVSAQTSKHITEMAAQILIEDADYLIRQLQ